MIFNRKTKSNRAQADYFELLVCQYICHLSNVRFSYSANLARLSNQILTLPDGPERLKLQNKNLIKIELPLKKVIDYEVSKKGKIIEVLWTGRMLTIKTTSDVDAEHISRKLTRFSIKSIKKGGTGTIKNLGMRTLKKYLNVDFAIKYEEMWNNLRNYTQQFNISKTELKENVIKNKEWLNWAIKNGRKYQIELNRLCYRGFNNLTNEDKVKFLNFILDAEDPDLYVIIVNINGVVLYKPIEEKIKLIDIIEARKDPTSMVGYSIFINGIPTYRIQTNNTNGIGISPFCQRVFKV